LSEQAQEATPIVQRIKQANRIDVNTVLNSRELVTPVLKSVI